MAERAPGVPAQTITMSSDAFIRELDLWLRKSLAGFVVYRSAYYTRLRHLECTEVLMTKAYVPLFEVVQLAIEHDCPGSPE